MVSLHIHDPNVTLGGNLAQVLDQGCRDTLPSVFCTHSEVIGIQFAACPLELVEFVSDEPAENLLVLQCTRATTCSFASRPLMVASLGGSVP